MAQCGYSIQNSFVWSQLFTTWSVRPRVLPLIWCKTNQTPGTRKFWVGISDSYWLWSWLSARPTFLPYMWPANMLEGWSYCMTMRYLYLPDHNNKLPEYDLNMFDASNPNVLHLRGPHRIYNRILWWSVIWQLCIDSFAMPKCPWIWHPDIGCWKAA